VVVLVSIAPRAALSVSKFHFYILACTIKLLTEFALWPEFASVRRTDDGRNCYQCNNRRQASLPLTNSQTMNGKHLFVEYYSVDIRWCSGRSADVIDIRI